MYEHPLRSLLKGISWQTLGLFSTMLISYWFTGSLFQSIGMALTLSGLSLIVYVAHERLWEKLPFGRHLPPKDPNRVNSG